MAVDLVIIDDNELVCRSLQRNLGLFGYENCRIFTSALDYILEGYPYSENTVIICDYKMPGMTGVELAEDMAMRGMATRIIILTASPEEAKKEAKELGISVVIANKLRPVAELCELIQKARNLPAFSEI